MAFLGRRAEKVTTEVESRYRDPRPDEINEDEGLLMKLLPPDRQAYWRQVQVVPSGAYAVPRYMNYASSYMEADVRAYQNELLCAALKDMAEQSRLLRQALEAVAK